MDRVTEDDLLALIEGVLPEERRADVEAALRADPSLVERVRRMKGDRERLAELAQGDSAPAGLVEGAMARADLTRLVQVDTGGPVRETSLARGSRGRRLQMGIAAVLVIGALGVWVWLMAIVSSSSERRAAFRPKSPLIARVDSEGKVETESSQADTPGPVGPEAPKRMEVRGPSVREAMRSIAAPKADETEDNSLLNQWLANLNSGQGPQGTGRLMDWDQAAELALAGKLRINVAGTGPMGVALGEAGEGASELLDYQLMRKGSGMDEGWRVEVSFRVGEAKEDLAGALEKAVTELQERTGRRVWVSEAKTVDEEAGPAPATDIGSVLWWGEDAADWARRESVRLPVSFVAK